MKPNHFLQIFFIFYFFLILIPNIKANTYLWENSTWEGDLTGVQWGSQALGDIDNNGFLDLVVIGFDTLGNTRISKVYTNNGTSLTDNSSWSVNLTNVHYGSIALGDIDNDGDLDLTLTGCSAGGGYSSGCSDNAEKSFIYTNNGSSFIENRTLKGDITDIWRGSIALGDIDNDGKLDLVLTGQTTIPSNVISKVYINNGTGFAENSTWQTDLTAIDSSAVVLGDIDNDNNLDLIISGEDSGNTKHTEVYINNDSSFARNTTWDINLLAVGDSSLVLGDFNNDGNLDLSLIGCCDEHRIYNNTGSTFVETQDSGGTGDLIGVFAGSISLGDYDNDGDLDMITTGREKETVLYLGNNSGLFTSYTQDPEAQLANLQYSLLDWADLDNDSDLDLILMGLSGDNFAYVYINNITTPNSKPEAPNSSFNASFDDGKLILEWGNGSDAETSVLGLYYNLRVGTSSEGNDVISGVFGGGDDNGYFGNMMQRKSISIKGLDASTTYYYSVQTIDTGLQKSSWSNEQAYTTAADIVNPTIKLIFPASGYYSNKDYVHFGANVTDETDLKNVTLWGDWTGSYALNETNTTGTNANHTFNVSLNDGTYNYYIQACDDTGNCAETSSRTFYVDTTYPNISLNSPLNSSTWSSSSTVNFTYNVSDISIVNCSLIINDEIDQTDDSINLNVHQSFTKTLSNGNYNWSINCTDNVDQLNNSETWELTVSYTSPTTTPPSSTTTSGGGGGSAARVAAAEAIRAKSQVKAQSIPRVYDKISKGETKSYENKKTEISISEITFDTKEDVQQGEISVNSLKSVSNPIIKNVYQYLEIINNFDIKEAKIKFNVEKDWIFKNNIDKSTVKLNRFTDNWNELITNEIGSTNINIIYESISPGFSYFAVTGENKTVVEKVEEILEEKELEIEKPSEVKKKGINVLIWIIIIFFVLLIWYYFVGEYFRKKRKEEENKIEKEEIENVHKKRN